MAKLTVAIPSPVAVLMGDRNKPDVRRMPAVIIRITAAAATRKTAARTGFEGKEDGCKSFGSFGTLLVRAGVVSTWGETRGL
jgi:hypothetical protein